MSDEQGGNRFGGRKAEGAARGGKPLSRARSVAFCGLSIALLTVSAWVTVPLGPVPFTLQTMMLAFLVLAFPPREALISVFGYLAIGAVGLPVFSGMRGGLAALLGPTGGFLIGFGLGACAALLVLRAWREPASPAASRARELVAAFTLLAVSYACGWAQLMAVAGLDPTAAFLAGIAPFILLDVAKTLIGAALARTMRRAIPALRGAVAGGRTA